MAFFIGIGSMWLILTLTGYIFGLAPLKDLTSNGRIAASVMFIMIGTMHFVKPQSMSYMIDNFLPYSRELVFLSGALEIVLAVGLLIPAYRHYSAWGLIVLLILIFPANINVAVNQLPPPGGLPAKPWYVWSRLAFQPLYILWIWWCALR